MRSRRSKELRCVAAVLNTSCIDDQHGHLYGHEACMLHHVTSSMSPEKWSGRIHWWIQLPMFDLPLLDFDVGAIPSKRYGASWK